MTDHRQGLVFVGLPGAGKSSYLALLYLAIWGGNSQLEPGSVQDDRRYVNELSGRLHLCSPQTHTAFGNLEGLTLSVKGVDGEAVLGIPDVSGENWEQALAERRLPGAVVAQIEGAAGVCIFLNVDDIVDDPTFKEMEESAAALGAEPGEPGDNAEFADPTLRATQVQVVDLIQEIARFWEDDAPLISVVLSAFDMVDRETPGAWLAANLPLLDQYLAANASRMAVRVYGVSAQGGDFRAPDTKKDLLKKKALDRAFVRSHDGADAPIDAPVLWALGLMED